MELTEARRVELAKQAHGMVALEEKFSAAQDEVREGRKAVEQQHKEALKELEKFRKEHVEPLSAKVYRARNAMGALVAHFVDRPLVTAEANAKATISKLTREIGIRGTEVDQAKVMLGKVSQDGSVHKQLQSDLARAEKELTQELEKLEVAHAEWDEARAALDEAIKAALRVELDEPEGAK